MKSYFSMWQKLQKEMKELSTGYHVQLMDSADFEAFRRHQGMLLAWNTIMTIMQEIEEESGSEDREGRED